MRNWINKLADKYRNAATLGMLLGLLADFLRNLI
jgi:hypothetical protein